MRSAEEVVNKCVRESCLSLLVLGLVFAGTASAQTQSDQTAIVITVAPIYLNPDTTRLPLRTASVGTTLRVLDDAGDWLHVQFQDPQYGLRVGYIQKQSVRLSQPAQEPMDLSIPTGRATTSASEGTPRQPITKHQASGGYGMACVGQASTPGFVGFDASFTAGGQSFAGEVGGASDHVFGAASVGYLHFSDFDTHALETGAIVGGDVVPRSIHVHACPLAGFTYVHYNDADLNEVDVHAGGSIGIVALQSNSLMVIPFVEGIYTHAIVLNQDTSADVGNLTFGVGLSFDRRISVIPQVLIPINTGTSDPTFELRVTFGF
jgi:hypothetical protein